MVDFSKFNTTGVGGTFHINQFFSGENFIFGLTYQLNEKIQVVAELSSDDYDNEDCHQKDLIEKMILIWELNIK